MTSTTYNVVRELRNNFDLDGFRRGKRILTVDILLVLFLSVEDEGNLIK